MVCAPDFRVNPGKSASNIKPPWSLSHGAWSITSTQTWVRLWCFVRYNAFCSSALMLTFSLRQLVLVVEGRRLMYHQAVVAQHSSLLKDLMLRWRREMFLFANKTTYLVGKKSHSFNLVIPSSLFLPRTGCCKCQGEHCRRVSGDVVVRFLIPIL